MCGNCGHEYKIKEGIANFLLPSHLGESELLASLFSKKRLLVSIEVGIVGGDDENIG